MCPGYLSWGFWIEPAGASRFWPNGSIRRRKEHPQRRPNGKRLVSETERLWETTLLNTLVARSGNHGFVPRTDAESGSVLPEAASYGGIDTSIRLN